ncbi:GNAT family N-acetyltransferase [Chryseobacterium sp. 6424]|jgi:ribosomal protein S18 acetylase RimI-like enzyme|uniref:GNAT family N-acetyltransferase n=1 Tax=Chryseobacterium sp. 6424 TaxID=2039166 RepID=UPI001E350EF8|nr:GNAT family N-acetyltransferase [Chryseobacterium sp. 6424]
MMEYLRIPSFDDFRAQQIFKSYSDTFPVDERRSEAQFRALFQHPKVKVLSVLKDLDYIGYLIVWELTHFVFIEHFEIFSDFRSMKYGSEIIGDLFKQYSHIVLEAEPADLDDTAQRRILFYERNGFKVIDQNYVQPCYEVGKQPLNLWLMANWQPTNIEWIKEEIYDIVYC